jgi:hypothetical protein
MRGVRAEARDYVVGAGVVPSANLGMRGIQHADSAA